MSGASHCAVIEVGGTTSDIGIAVDGFPRQASGGERGKGGAKPDDVSDVDFEELALPYLPANAVRVRAKAVGAIRMREECHG